jgi:hypothetical protein
MVTMEKGLGGGGQERLQNDCNTREQKKRYSARCSGNPGKAFVFRSGSEVAVYCLGGSVDTAASQCASTCLLRTTASLVPKAAATVRSACLLRVREMADSDLA